jgi:hypothetical protein
VAQQLPLLTALRELDLVGLGFRSVPQPSLQPLVDAIASMGGLRSLKFLSSSGYSCASFIVTTAAHG